MKRVVSSVVLLLTAALGCGLDRDARMAGPAPKAIAKQRPTLGAHEIAVTWLGVAGALVRGHEKTVAFDPYVSRLNPVTWNPNSSTMFGNGRPDTAAIDRYIPKVDLILIGHAHEDHILDAPYLVQRDGADLVGSLTAVTTARGYGAPTDKLHVVGPGEWVHINGVGLGATRTGHITVLGKVPGAGSNAVMKPQPMRGNEFKTGGPRFWRVLVDDVKVGHLSSAKLLKEELPPGLDVDVLFFSVAQMKKDEHVVERLLQATHPRFVVPIHQDVFFLDLEEDPRPMPGFDMDTFKKDVAAAWPDATVVDSKPMTEMILNVKTGNIR